ncbi:hypothetical protein N7495_008893 [Penicillium taxi]|uniref:uncharacterized protein n=1 Tax=Penicillium taxi TaxID=168475 RepID=UPI002544FE6E|nr:uncharacterized protein N7495_008893 [Penicillium taxi]KAJ5888852.1 hypothetical protein N7495_008893 [Penicillium taxi]
MTVNICKCHGAGACTQMIHTDSQESLFSIQCDPENADKPLNITEAMGQYFNTSLIGGSKCGTCGNPQLTATRLSHPPEILFVKLNRIHWSTTKRAIQISQRIMFSKSLILPAHGFDPRLKELREPVEYQLSSLQLHRGETTNKGHYLAVVRGPRGSWTLCDDKKVTPYDNFEAMAKSKDVQQSSYIFAYRRCPLRLDKEDPFAQAKAITEKISHLDEQIMKLQYDANSFLDQAVHKSPIVVLAEFPIGTAPEFIKSFKSKDLAGPLLSGNIISETSTAVLVEFYYTDEFGAKKAVKNSNNMEVEGKELTFKLEDPEERASRSMADIARRYAARLKGEILINVHQRPTINSKSPSSSHSSPYFAQELASNPEKTEKPRKQPALSSSIEVDSVTKLDRKQFGSQQWARFARILKGVHEDFEIMLNEDIADLAQAMAILSMFEEVAQSKRLETGSSLYKATELLEAGATKTISLLYQASRAIQYSYLAMMKRVHKLHEPDDFMEVKVPPGELDLQNIRYRASKLAYLALRSMGLLPPTSLKSPLTETDMSVNEILADIKGECHLPSLESEEFDRVTDDIMAKLKQEARDSLTAEEVINVTRAIMSLSTDLVVGVGEDQLNDTELNFAERTALQLVKMDSPPIPPGSEIEVPAEVVSAGRLLVVLSKAAQRIIDRERNRRLYGAPEGKEGRLAVKYTTKDGVAVLDAAVIGITSIQDTEKTGIVDQIKLPAIIDRGRLELRYEWDGDLTLDASMQGQLRNFIAHKTATAEKITKKVALKNAAKHQKGTKALVKPAVTKFKAVGDAQEHAQGTTSQEVVTKKNSKKAGYKKKDAADDFDVLHGTVKLAGVKKMKAVAKPNVAKVKAKVKADAQVAAVEEATKEVEPKKKAAKKAAPKKAAMKKIALKDAAKPAGVNKTKAVAKPNAAKTKTNAKART